jgi:hypothetical protein
MTEETPSIKKNTSEKSPSPTKQKLKTGGKKEEHMGSMDFHVSTHCRCRVCTYQISQINRFGNDDKLKELYYERLKFDETLRTHGNKQ